MKRIIVIGALAWSATAVAASGAPDIHIEDVARFYKVYDAANGQPSAEQLQRDYLDAGSEGLHQLPGNLGYWVGYRIAKSYYQRAADPRSALREILDMSDPKAFLAKSGWYPGIELK